MTRRQLDTDGYRRALNVQDLTDVAAGPHAMQLIVGRAIAALRDSWCCPVIVYRHSPIVTLEDNYDRLRYPPDAAARDARYTRYVTDTTVLRTHTTAMIPGLLRAIASAGYADVLLACPGLVYRRDAIDRLHSGEPHQLDLWRVRAGSLDEGALDDMIRRVVAATLPGGEVRWSPAVHPYTEHGRQIDARVGGGWVEIGECGLALPDLLAEAGVDPAIYSGLAMGLGLDRILMLRKGIDDIRVLRAPDPRIAEQMLDLSPYRQVSAQPPVRRDLSIAVAEEVTSEELGDRVRTALGDWADSVETVEVLTETRAAALPPAAVARLGIGPGQKNVLLRVVLRHPSRTLTDSEANGLRDRIYRALHDGRDPGGASG